MSQWPASLPWLQSASESFGDAASVWNDLEVSLAGELGNLEVGQFLILNAKVAAAGTGELAPGRYVQFNLVRRNGDRVLVAEASSARFQPAAVRHGRGVIAQLDRMGWRLDPVGGNHQYLYPWPEDIGRAAQDSLAILRDLWSIPHPELVQWNRQGMAAPNGSTEPAAGSAESALGAGPVFEPDSPEDLIAKVRLWLDSGDVMSGVTVEPLPDGSIAAFFGDSGVKIESGGPTPRLLLTAMVTSLSNPAVSSSPALWNNHLNELGIIGTLYAVDHTLMLTEQVFVRVLTVEMLADALDDLLTSSDRLARALSSS
ncbi:MAG: hypothetical protein WCP28_19125 [Actinomycetes bacterium]